MAISSVRRFPGRLLKPSLLGDSVSPADVLEGVTFHDSAGMPSVGTFVSRRLESITISSPPDKTWYAAGDDFDPTGMVVERVYSDGSVLSARAFDYEPKIVSASTAQIVVSIDEGGITATAAQPVHLFPASFSSASWQQIIMACESGSIPSTWAIGDSKQFSIYRQALPSSNAWYAVDQSGDVFEVVIVAKNHDGYQAGGTAPLTFMVFCQGNAFPYHSVASASIGYLQTDMAVSVLPDLISAMEAFGGDADDIAGAMKTVVKNVYGADQPLDIWLPSKAELVGDPSSTAESSDTILPYFTGGSHINGSGDLSVSSPWTRSQATDLPSGVQYSRFIAISTGTTGDSTHPHTDALGVYPCFCL